MGLYKAQGYSAEVFLLELILFLIKNSFCDEIDVISRPGNANEAKEIKNLRKRGLFVLYEVLKYPRVLKDQELNRLFADFLLATQRNGALKMVDTILPGLI